MNGQRTILLAVAVTILALTSSAKAYTMERIYPASQSVYVPAIPEAQILTYHARFSGLIWPYIWHQADWYWDGQLYYSDDGLGGQTTESYCLFPGTSVGTHEIKVRAKYDSAPFGVHVWTSYLTWTLTIVDPGTYTIERVNPAESSCSTPVHVYPQLEARFGGIASPATWYEAQWYVDGVLEKTQALSGQTAQSFCYHTFNTVGTYEVKVHGKYLVGLYPVVTRDLTWTVNVVPHPPTASRVSPASPVTVQAGETRAFTVRGTDPGSGMDGLNIAFVRWYLDGAQQGDFEVGPQPVHETVEHTWSHTFGTGGTHQVEAVFYDTDGYSSASGQAAWTVVVERQVHEPSASIVSPGSSVTVYAGGSVTFEAAGADAGNDLRLCEVSLDGAPQTNASFSGAASGSTAEWTHTFSAPGTYHVAFIPLDLAGDHGSACTWTVEVETHDPSGTIVSPSSSVTIDQGTQETFTLRGTDPGGDLWLCEVSLDGAFQTSASFSSAAGGSTAEWTCTFNTPGTHHVGFVPLDLAGNRGTVCTWTVEVEAHSPSGTIVSPSSPVTVCTGVPVTFTLEGADPAGDLWLCEVSVDGVFQTSASFSGVAGGSTAAWTHTFNTPGTHQILLRPLDWANNYGTANVWTVVVEVYSKQAGLTGVVIELDAQGRAKGPLAGAKVDLAGPAAGTAATDGQGKFAFAGLNPGAYTANVSKTGYYAQSRSVSLATGETRDEVFRLTPESLTPSAFDFSSPDGKHFIEGMPGSVSLSIIVAWNGSPGSVRFNLADTWHTATITDLGAGKAQASLNVTVPTVVSNSSELLVEVANGDGERTIVNTGVYLYPIPPIIATWFPGWQGQEQAPDYAFEKPWDLGKPIKYGDVEMKAEAGLQGQLRGCETISDCALF